MITVAPVVSAEEQKTVWAFLQNFDYIPYQQFPEYGAIESVQTTGFIGSRGGTTVAWAQVVEKKHILAVIEFGPLAQSQQDAEDLLMFIARHYKKRFFLLLRWVPYCYDEGEYDRLAAAIGKRFSFLNAYPVINWSSKKIPLHADADAILKTFSENHRRSIKKAKTQQIACRKITQDELQAFSEGFIAMYQHRKLDVDKTMLMQSFDRLFAYLQQSGNGFFMGAFSENALLGGIIILYQGKTAFYYKGFIDHLQRQLPINHIAFYHAIVSSKEDGMDWFDFGGYAVDTDDEQLININKFKDGFRGTLVHFPKTRMMQLHGGLKFLGRLFALYQKHASRKRRRV